jgi:DNA primase large subunit
MPAEDLRQSPMMSHLLDALDQGEDIGHYGRLTLR